MIDHINNNILANQTDLCIKEELSEVKNIKVVSKRKKYSVIFKTKPPSNIKFDFC